MKPRMVGTLVSLGLATALVAAPAAASAGKSPKGLHVVASPVIANSSLAGAAVIGPGDMWAVGSSGTATGPSQTLAEHFDGTSWTVVPTPPLNASLAGVAGAASTDVWGVGGPVSGQPGNALIEHWDGTSWSVTPSPALPPGSELTGVTAPPPTTPGPSGSRPAPRTRWWSTGTAPAGASSPAPPSPG